MVPAYTCGDLEIFCQSMVFLHIHAQLIYLLACVCMYHVCICIQTRGSCIIMACLRPYWQGFTSEIVDGILLSSPSSPLCRIKVMSKQSRRSPSKGTHVYYLQSKLSQSNQNQRRPAYARLAKKAAGLSCSRLQTRKKPETWNATALHRQHAALNPPDTIGSCDVLPHFGHAGSTVSHRVP